MRNICVTVILMAASAAGTYAADVKAGQAAYDKACKSCHRADGTANPAIAKAMKVEMRDLQSPEVQAMSAADIKKVIVEGKGKMKPVTSIKGGAVDDIAAYVKTMKK
jgi:mono/diheme cytochrome c family protein